LDEHLGYERHAPVGRGSGNSRNGYSGKTLKGDLGAVPGDCTFDCVNAHP
jgi:transposase-like protein